MKGRKEGREFENGRRIGKFKKCLKFRRFDFEENEEFEESEKNLRNVRDFDGLI